MNRLSVVIGVVISMLLASSAMGITEEGQALADLKLRVEKMRQEAQAREESLWKEIKHLQAAVKELREQRKKGKKKDLAGKEEVEVLRAKLAEAEARAREMEQVAKAQRERAVAALEEARAQAARAEAIQAEMQDRIRRLEALLKELQPGKGADTPPKGLPKVDVPKEPVKGKLTKVDPDDPALIEIDIGSDLGLKGGHTLEIFRLTPQPTYLGTVRILQVRPTRSVGRVVATNPLKKETQIRIGDQVASQIK